MRTPLEALFDAMINGGWFTDSDGDVESPTGHFAYVTNTAAEVPEILAAFTDTTDVYGVPATDDLVGSFVVTTNSDGILYVDSHHNPQSAQVKFELLQDEFAKWSAE